MTIYAVNLPSSTETSLIETIIEPGGIFKIFFVEILISLFCSLSIVDFFNLLISFLLILKSFLQFNPFSEVIRSITLLPLNDGKQAEVFYLILFSENEITNSDRSDFG